MNNFIMLSRIDKSLVNNKATIDEKDTETNNSRIYLMSCIYKKTIH